MPENKTKGNDSRKRDSKRNAARRIRQLVDVEGLDASNPALAVKDCQIQGKPLIRKCELLIVGGGMGGVAAAIAACQRGVNVCLTEETSWLGGQMTSQAVSALDENYMVETSGATRRYKAFRSRVRDYYKAQGAVEGQARFEEFLDPGNCWVSRLAFEPKVAVKILGQILQPFLDDGRLQIFVRTAAVAARTKGGKLRAVQCVDLDSGKALEFRCRFCIDATELGDMLALAGLDYRSGAESRLETGEAHAPELANPENVQDFTYPFIVEFCPGENHRIAKPPHYDEFKQAGKFSFLGYRMFEDNAVEHDDGTRREFLPFWEYRRLIARSNFPSGAFPNDIAMINWESNDLRGENIIDQAPLRSAERLALGKCLSLGFLYWLQNEALRDDGAAGYPELKLRADLIGTRDGLSKYPYIRESRRIKALYTIVESDITRAANHNCRARLFADSLGVGFYPVDIHGKQDVPGAGQQTRPFQIPAAAMIQDRLRNFLPACKNIGTTHVTNGAYRLHPIEWGIGEAAGTFAAEVLATRSDIRRLCKNKRSLRRLQNQLVCDGAPLFWFDDVSPEDEAFAAIQFVSICSLMRPDDLLLSFRPQDSISRAEAARAVAALLHLPEVKDACQALMDLPASNPAYRAAVSCVSCGIMRVTERGEFEPSRALTRDELKGMGSHRSLSRYKAQLPEAELVSRAGFAIWLYGLCTNKRFLGRN